MSNYLTLRELELSLAGYREAGMPDEAIVCGEVMDWHPPVATGHRPLRTLHLFSTTEGFESSIAKAALRRAMRGED